jgi:hypothetical protein
MRTHNSKKPSGVVVAIVLVWTVVAVLAARIFLTAPHDHFGIRSLFATGGAELSTPYTVVTTETLTAKGVSKSGGRYTVALASNGDKVEWKEVLATAGRSKQFSQRVLTFADGRRIITNELLGLQATVAKSPSSAALRRPDSSCVVASKDERLLRRETFAGRSAAVVRRAEGNVTTWYAEDLGCALLRDLILWSSGSVTDRSAIWVEEGEPSPDLFELKYAYREVSVGDLSGSRRLPEAVVGK